MVKSVRSCSKSIARSSLSRHFIIELLDRGYTSSVHFDRDELYVDRGSHQLNEIGF